MNDPVVKFNRADRPEFYRTLRSRVNTYFKERNISKHANLNMKIKTVFMVVLYLTPLCLMVSGAINTVGLMFLMWFLMGLGMSGIGLSVMHDANHGSYSNNQKVNHFLGSVLYLIGGYAANWKIQHNVLHHSFTNIHGFDEDIDKGVIRFSPTQKRKPIYKYQLFYAPFLYGIMTFYWLVAKDFEQIYRYNKRNLLEAQGVSYSSAIIKIIIGKCTYVFLTLILPMMVLPIVWWQVLLGFLMMQFITGLILAAIFQPAHVIEDTDFYIPDEDLSIENNWAIHQMKTTSNFANGSTIFSWLIGGLNYQIEHHLFPNICHVHYKDISKIVKSTAEEFGVPYYHHKTFFSALKSHFTLLHSLGTGSYDRALAAQR